MPVLRALAGRSPSWAAVFVQMEHCAEASTTQISNIIISGNIRWRFFIVLKLTTKVRSKAEMDK
jgi:hypothetical protein